MDNQGEYVLLIESGLGAATLIRDALAEAKDGTFFVDRAESLSVGLERLNQEGLKAILLNLYLSDSQGIETFDKLYQREKHIPILIMTTLEHEDVARLAIQRGAQDYLLIDHSNCYPMSRAIRNVMERTIAEDALFIERERAQVTLNSIGDAVISTDLAGNVTYLNAAAERMTGWSQAEAQGQPFTTVFCLINGATREPLPSRMELAIEENKPVGLPLDSVLIRRDGTEVSIEDSAAAFR
jgi:PAS domain S-box-containing protein